MSGHARAASVPPPGGGAATTAGGPAAAAAAASSSSPHRPATTGGAPRLTKAQMYNQWGDEFKECELLSKHQPSFNMERQIDRDQRARGMVRISDRVFQSLAYSPSYQFADKHQRIIDLRRHTGRKFDQSAGFFTPVGAHLAYDHVDDALHFLDPKMHGNVAFGRLPARVPDADRLKARFHEEGITRRKHMLLHPHADVPCPVPRLSREQRAAATPPQRFFRSVRHTQLENARSGNEVDATCGSPAVVRSAIDYKFPCRNKGHSFAHYTTREQRTKHGYESGKERPLSTDMAPLVVRYGGVGGRGSGCLLPIGDAPKSHISFGKAKRMRVERGVQDAIERTQITGNSEVNGKPIKAFDFTRRKLWRSISLGPGFKSANEEDD